MRHKTPDESEWLRNNVTRMTHRETLDAFEKEFGWRLSDHSLSSWKSNNGIRSKTHWIKWTPEKVAFMREYIPGHTESEIREEFAKRFGHVLTEGQIANCKVRLGIKSGTHGGRFEKGFKPWNKGKTWDELGMSEKSRKACARGQFKKGNEPIQGKRVPIGSERINADGYVEVKVSKLSSKPCMNKCWRPKHHLVWEEANRRKVQEGHVILFADNDRTNFDPDNLVEVPRGLLGIINREGIKYADRDTLFTAMDIAKARHAIHSARCHPRACKSCGNVFTPRYPHQRTCDECLGHSDAPQNST